MAARHQQQEEEAESAFVSMTDLTVSFLFVLLILLAFFVSQYSDEETVPLSRFDTVLAERDEALAMLEAFRLKNADLRQSIAALEAEIETLRTALNRRDAVELYGAQSSQLRHEMITRLAAAVQDDILREDIEGLTVTAQGDALRFQGAGLFASGQGGLSGSSLRIIRLLGEHLERELPCYVIGPAGKIEAGCNPDLVLLETLQVEGHTDADGSLATNMTLSTARAVSAFNVIAPQDRTGADPKMLGFENLLEQPVLAVAGYGETRPISGNETAKGKAANRRIDLRFIMYVPPGKDFIPTTIDDIARVRRALRTREDL